MAVIYSDFLLPSVPLFSPTRVWQDMAYFDITVDSLGSLEGQVAIITGVSSGIGLATAQLFVLKGATVIGCDLQDPPKTVPSSNFTFWKTDVTSWKDLRELFDCVDKQYGRIDIVCANAGITPKADFLNLEQDAEGNLLEPTKLVLEVNLKAVVDTVSLAAHYMQRKESKGGNIILTASCTAYQRFAGADYVAAKHGVLGLLRSLSVLTNTPEIPVRINAVAPSWTMTGMIPLSAEEFDKIGVVSQSPHAVAKGIVYLACDQARHGQCLYSSGGRYVEMEGPMHEAMLKEIGKTALAEEDERVKLYKRIAEIRDGQ